MQVPGRRGGVGSGFGVGVIFLVARGVGRFGFGFGWGGLHKINRGSRLRFRLGLQGWVSQRDRLLFYPEGLRHAN